MEAVGRSRQWGGGNFVSTHIHEPSGGNRSTSGRKFVAWVPTQVLTKRKNTQLIGSRTTWQQRIGTNGGRFMTGKKKIKKVDLMRRRTAAVHQQLMCISNQTPPRYSPPEDLAIKVLHTPPLDRIKTKQKRDENPKVQEDQGPEAATYPVEFLN
ncbi:hypothetical protein BDK51DRAFT_32409 [Blyttiomyces helicus]|uniref:Uncharacterized protein n=1 Tax=Blyttiomyces helicus TaxID=388810 RepID=A0A4V1IPM6_9FUNG|nr:hypothetical protein BDK51DRAFT_32409 [Blyttiomyces helicus]|eukprot:RKO83587.1 hypothetical protein BDK51DRAFT_32409 [Blyttiomyces helicus]